ncbi:hypothetical protein EDB80DRAFT_750663 [Ilyonectria destructans]|nr:hypothetical protein EDB80DRAFT_750663 [Ilyonectria destructans]
MPSTRQIFVYGMIFSSATTIGYDSGYLNGVLGSEDFIRRYGVSDDGGDSMYLTPYTRNIFSSRLGRKGSLFVASIAYALGVILQTIGLPPAAFVIGRILLGSALGFISNMVPAYLMDYGTSKYTDSRGWRVTIGFQLFLAVAIFFGAIICPESPFVLTKRNKLVQAYVAEISSHGNVRVLECFQGTNLRRTLLDITMSFFTIATGIIFWFGYRTTFFIAAGVNNSYMISLILAIVNCVFTAPSIYLIERLGRRKSLLWGGAIMVLTQILTGVIHTVAPNSNTNKNRLVAGAVIFIAVYAPTWGIAGWVVMTEPFSNRMRVYQTAVVMTLYWTVTWLVRFITPYMVDEIAGDLGVNVAYIWFGVGVLSLIWAYLCVPELAGLSTSEVDLLFEGRVAAWRSVAWQKGLRTLHSVEMSRSNEKVASVASEKVDGGEKV